VRWFLTTHVNQILEVYLRRERTKEAADREQKGIFMRAEKIEQESTLSKDFELGTEKRISSLSGCIREGEGKGIQVGRNCPNKNSTCRRLDRLGVLGMSSSIGRSLRDAGELRCPK
jgi:hypothetical protein